MRSRSRRKRGRGRRTTRHRGFAIAALVFGGVSLTAAGVMLGAACCLNARAALPRPSADVPMGAGDSVTDSVDLPAVDWAYWKSVNPAIVAWLTVPGTGISQPIVQAPADDPDYYLDHDVFGTWNPWGAVFLDAGCSGSAEGVRNTIVYGHHMDDGSMFAPLAAYSDAGWACEHTIVHVQTEAGAETYRVRFVQVVDNAESPKRICFDDDADFGAWYRACLDEAAVIVDDDVRPRAVLTLVTCSYTRYDDERTVVVCSLAP